MAKSNRLPIAETNAMPTVSKPSADDRELEMKYRAEDALRDIERAENHKSDKNLMKYVKQAAKTKIKAMKKIC